MQQNLRILLVLILTAGLVTPAGADIYKYVDKYGRVTLTDKPKSDKYKRLVKTWKGWTEAKSQIALRDMKKNKRKYTSTINWFADHYHLPKSLIHASPLPVSPTS